MLTLVSNKTALRKLSNILWSDLSLLVELALKTISSIHSTVEYLVSPETFASLPFKTHSLVNLAIDCLLQVGLVLNESRQNNSATPAH